MRAVAIAAFAALALAACTEAEKADVKEDTDTIAADVKQSASEIANSSAVSNLKAEAKDAAQDTGAVLKKGAAEVKEGAADVAAMAKARAAKVRAEAAREDNETTTTTTTTTTERTTTR